MDKELRDLLGKRFIQLQKVEWHDSPFPLDEYEASIWHRGRLGLMQWVLEMMPTEEENGL